MTKTVRVKTTPAMLSWLVKLVNFGSYSTQKDPGKTRGGRHAGKTSGGSDFQCLPTHPQIQLLPLISAPLLLKAPCVCFSCFWMRTRGGGGRRGGGGGGAESLAQKQAHPINQSKQRHSNQLKPAPRETREEREGRLRAAGQKNDMRG